MQPGPRSDNAGEPPSPAAHPENSAASQASDDAARQAAFAEWMPPQTVTDVDRGDSNPVAVRSVRGVLQEADGRTAGAAGRLLVERSATGVEDRAGNRFGAGAGDDGEAPQVRHVQFQYRYEFRPSTWLGRFLGATFALVAGATMLALFAFSFAFFFLPLFALAFLFLFFLFIFQRRGEHKGGSDRSGHGRVRPADTPPDNLVEQQVVRGVLLRKIERR